MYVSANQKGCNASEEIIDPVQLARLHIAKHDHSYTLGRSSFLSVVPGVHTLQAAKDTLATLGKYHRG